MIKLALFGAGRIGKIHGHNVALNPQAELVALHDPYQVNADHLSAALGCKQMTLSKFFQTHLLRVFWCVQPPIPMQI